MESIFSCVDLFSPSSPHFDSSFSCGAIAAASVAENLQKINSTSNRNLSNNTMEETIMDEDFFSQLFVAQSAPSKTVPTTTLEIPHKSFSFSQLLQVPQQLPQRQAATTSLKLIQTPVPTLALPTRVINKTTPPSSTTTPTEVKTQRISNSLQQPAQLAIPASNAGSERKWRTLLVAKEVVSAPQKASVLLKARRGNLSEEVEDCLYSSIKYEMEIRFDQDAFQTQKSKFVLVKVQAVDAMTCDEILKEDGKGILDGTLEGSFSCMTQPSKGYYSTSLRIFFTDVSYHHSNRPFAFKVSLCSDTNPNEPFMVKVSPGFLVRARKPNEARKRKRTSEEKTTTPAATVKKQVEPSPKKQRTVTVTASTMKAPKISIIPAVAAATPLSAETLGSLDSFELKLQAFMDSFASLDEKNKKAATAKTLAALNVLQSK